MNAIGSGEGQRPATAIRRFWARRWIWWYRWRGWWLLTTSASVGASVGLIMKDWFAGGAAAGSAALIVAVVTQIGTRGRNDVEARSSRRRTLPSQVLVTSEGGGLRKVRDLPQAVSFRVHPAATAEGNDGRPNLVPPYVKRDVDPDIEKVLVGTAFVLLVGESTAGKTRTAYEVVKRTLPDHVFVAPKGRKELEHVVITVLEHRRCVVWLDDVERFLGPDGLTPSTINRVLGDGSRHTVVIATVRTSAYDRFGPRAESKAEGASLELLRSGRDALRMAYRFTVPRRWSQSELRRAEAERHDPRIKKALEHAHEFGIGELLAAGPQLLADWQNAWSPGQNPRGAAIVAAAIDCRRAGLEEAVDEATLRELHEHYLRHRTGGAGLKPESFEKALAWAVEPLPGTTSSLLIPVDHGYRAFDYLIDTVTVPVPARTWQVLLRRVSPHHSYDIGLAAYRQKLYDHAEVGLRQAMGGDVPAAEAALARCVGDAGRPDEAADRFQSLAGRLAVDLGPRAAAVLGARRQHAVYLGRAGLHDNAASLLGGLIRDCTAWLGGEHPETLASRYEQAMLVRFTGDLVTATRLLAGLIPDCTRALGIDDAMTLRVRHHYADALGEAGNFVRATVLLEELVRHRTEVIHAPDDPDALLARHQHATYLGRAGRHREAANLFAAIVRDRIRVLGPGHPDTLVTRHQHATYLGQAGTHNEAARLFADLIQDCEALYGAEDQETLAARYQNGIHMWAAGKRAEAFRSLGALAADSTRALGPLHQITTLTHLTLDRWRNGGPDGIR